MVIFHCYVSLPECADRFAFLCETIQVRKLPFRSPESKGPTPSDATLPQEITAYGPGIITTTGLCDWHCVGGPLKFPMKDRFSRTPGSLRSRTWENGGEDHEMADGTHILGCPVGRDRIKD